MMSKQQEMDKNDYVLGDHAYGKGSVKLLHVVKNGHVHTIKEIEVETSLTLGSTKDYFLGDNSDIIATDSQKNTVYLLAKQHGIKSIEDFGIILSQHFLAKYSHVMKATVTIEQMQWDRISYGERANNHKLHNHAFIHTPVATRVCTITLKRIDKEPVVVSGIKNLRVLKTTNSSFVNFINDEFRTLPDQPDRIFSTIVDASWEYLRKSQIDFDKAWELVKYCILKNFAGDLDNGVASPSVQNTLYLAEKNALDLVSEIKEIEMTMPNKHYFNVDFSKFPSLVNGNAVETVFLPVDKPSGIIYGKLERSDSKL